MKKIILAVLYICVVILSCQTREYDSRLVIVDSLQRQEKNDSALKILEQINVRELSERDHAIFNMLKTFVLFKLFNLENYNDSIIDYSIQYFSSLYNKENKERLAEAYLYKACILMEQAHLSGATELLKKSEQLMPNNWDPDLRLRLFANLSYVNIESNNKEKGLYYLKKVLHDANKYSRNRWVAYAYISMDNYFYNVGQIDSSNYYAQKAIAYMNFLPTYDKAAFLSNLSLTYMNQKKFEQAESCLIHSLSIKPRFQAYGTLADLYTKMGRFTEAETLWKKAFHTNDNILRSTFLQPYAEWLYRIGKKEKAWEVAMKIPFIKDSVMRVQQTELVKESQERHDRQVEALHHKQQIERIGSIMAFTLLTLVVLWIYYHLKIQHQKKQLAEEQILIGNYTHQVEQLMADGHEQSKEVKELKRKIETLRKRQGDILHKGKARYEEIMNGGKAVTWHKADFNDFMEYYRMIDLSFVMEMEQQYRSLSASQRFFLSLRHLNYEEGTIQEIMGLSEGALRNLKWRIRTKNNKPEKI